MGAPSAVIAIASIAMGAYESSEQKAAQEDSIDRQRTNAKAVANRRRIEEDDKMSRLTSANIAKQAASPFADSSGSFGAITESNISNFSQDRAITNLNLANQMQNFATEEKSASRSEIFGDVNSVFSAANTYYSHSQLTKLYKPKGQGKEKPWYDLWD